MRYNNEQAVVYARYSSHNQTEQSIEGQLAAAREYADKHDYTIVHEYCDRAKTGAKYNYYVCTNQYLKKGCTRKAIRQDVLDEYVLDRLQILIADGAMIDYITDVTYNYYITHDQSRRDVEALEARLHNVEGAIANIIRSIEEGLPYSAVKRRMEELNEEKEELEKKDSRCKYQERHPDRERLHLQFPEEFPKNGH